ncbi:MAG TPA: aldehyde dehydrogenase (NADP(+)) [Pirellulaceae bacterium]|nr:aldehyde dehydrogenase (NADP(+)) [Pirellulaceae bacterium]HMO94142.1 aldehyde dehydrogenase (NADP(+)) [Pirellulaceae bacterium]HMP71213.1 aldehyde dehydrogenase (NADP(+)) [Pirellulaceae bacterium]
MQLQGRSFIGRSLGTEGSRVFCAFDPSTSNRIEPEFHSATADEIDRAAHLAERAALEYRKTSGKQRCEFLHSIADEILALESLIKPRVILETALSAPRIDGEFARTVNQMRMFADLAGDGSWVQARIDHADANRQPVPKPEVRSMLRPIGPVLVFGASNFPLAISTAGGDTASALAAGNPVIVKAHPAHPGTSEYMAQAILHAAEKCGMPEGVFSLLFDAGHQVGTALTAHPAVKAVGFTGSFQAGRALMNVAAARPEPIPFFAEMGSINPVIVLPGAAHARAVQIASGIYNAVTLGAGQFCTNPGLIILEADATPSGNHGSGPAAIVTELTRLMQTASQAAMLTSGICSAYKHGISRQASDSRMKLLVNPGNDAGEFLCRPALLETSAETLLSEPSLLHEVFGPSTIIAHTRNSIETQQLIQVLAGQLTGTIHGTDSELAERRDLIEYLEQKVGRVIVNGYPTGVEVCHAMIHGGPYPATSDGRATSIGTQSIFRFARPVCYQGVPDRNLPAELKESNPMGIWRLVDGEYCK